MPDINPTSYEEVPFPAKPAFPAHVDSLAAAGTLLGMTPAPVDRCRVLELGCATAANLLPMALALPDSTFVGIDESPRQIAMGQEIANRLGLKNVRLQPLGILELGKDFGAFDYIICHGVYSWVPAPVQERILTLCQQHLAPQGIAYVSYNTYPGWHFRGLAREAMLYHAGHLADPRMRVQQARAFLGVLTQSIPDAAGPYARLLQIEAHFLDQASDPYVLHDHLEDTNLPVYFHEFVRRAGAAGLQYVGESWFHEALDQLPPPMVALLQKVSANVVQLEQYLDFIRNRKFRRTLLCHANIALNQSPGPGVLSRLHLTGLVKPTSPRPDLRPERAEEFRTDEGATVQTSDPLVKAALLILSEREPGAVAYPELCDEIGRRVAVPPKGIEALARPMIQLYLHNRIAFHVYPPRFVLEPGNRPRASPLARLMAESGPEVTNLRHRLVTLDEADRALMLRLDGTRDRTGLGDVPDLAAALVRLARQALLVQEN